MTLTRIAPFIIVLLLPFLALAQDTAVQDAALREAIRADIMSDPRSSEMSATEIEAMTEALAAQSEDQGTAQQYLEMRGSFNEPLPPVYQPEPEEPQWDPMALAILALGIVLVGVVVFLVRHRKSHPASHSVS